MRTCIFDMETKGFDADFDRMICAVVKEYGTRRDEVVIKPKHHMNDDDAIVKLRDKIEQFDILVTFYGKGFDIPWLNSRLLLIGERRVKKIYHIDLYYVFRNKAKRAVRRKSLAHVADILNLDEQKMHISNAVWRAAHDGDAGAIDMIIERCKSDVRLTERVFNELNKCGWIDTLKKE